MTTHELSCGVVLWRSLGAVFAREGTHRGSDKCSLVCIATETVSARGKLCVPSHLRFTALASPRSCRVVSLASAALCAFACCLLGAFLVSTPRVDCFPVSLRLGMLFCLQLAVLFSFMGPGVASLATFSFESIHVYTVLCEALVPMHKRAPLTLCEALFPRASRPLRSHTLSSRAVWPLHTGGSTKALSPLGCCSSQVFDF